MHDTTYNAGTVFIGGGHLQNENLEVWTALHKSAGGGYPSIAVICSAASSLEEAHRAYYEDTPDFSSYQTLFRQYGFQPKFIPIAVDNYLTAAYAPENIKQIEASRVIWFNGGDQAKHARCLLTDNGSDTPLLTAIRRLYDKGGVISGSSAGAAIQGKFTYGEGNAIGYLSAKGLVKKQIPDISLLDDNNALNGGYTHGFKFLAGIGACVDTHFSERNRQGRLFVAMSSLKCEHGIGIDENTAIRIHNNIGRVYGSGRVMILTKDLVAKQAAAIRLAHNTAGLAAYWLSSGDIYDFEKGQAFTAAGFPLEPALSQP